MIATNADVIIGASAIHQVEQVSHKGNMEIRKAMNSGGAVVVQISGKKSQAVTSITSGDIATLVALNTSAFVNSGLYLTSSTITVPLKARSAGGFFATGGAHASYTGVAALIVPTSFDISQDADNATCALDIHWLSANGTTAEVLDTTGVTLGAQAFVDEYAMGPVYINGDLIPGAQSFKVTPGIEVNYAPPGAGLPRPLAANCSIKQVMPTIQIVVNDFDAIAGTVGLWTAMTSCNCYMRQREDAGVYEPAAAGIRFTFAGGLSDTESIDISKNEDGSATITLHGKTLTAATATIP